MATSDITSPPRTSYKDTSTECAICLTPFITSNNNESSSKTITLSCGHKWHLSCLKSQLEHARPTTSHRLLFSGCRCAKCGVYCDHESLRDLTRRTDYLRDKVDVLVEEQIRIDDPELWKATALASPDDAPSSGGAEEAGGANSSTSRNSVKKRLKALVEDGRRRYAFYLCASCDEPYFGGTVDCADDESHQGERPPNERYCSACAPSSGGAGAGTAMACRHPLEHRGYHVFKCRYCCRPSNHVCYGSVHFCEDCHDRNSDRVRVLRGVNSGSGDARPPPLQGIACVGGDNCPYPKPAGRDCHINGSSVDCEQVYYCAWCLSSGAMSGAEHEQESGSRNFVVNSSGEQGLYGWRPYRGPNQQRRGRQSGMAMWQVERSDIPISDDITTNFVSSFVWCGMYQVVALHQYVIDPSRVRVEVSAKFRGRTDCPSVFKMVAFVLDDNNRQLRSVETAELISPADYWERVSLVIDPVEGAHNVVMAVYGKDSRFWQGNYGSKVADCCVRVLCPLDDLDTVLRTDAHVNDQRTIQGQRVSFNWLKYHWFDILLPFLLLLAFWYL